MHKGFLFPEGVKQGVTNRSISQILSMRNINGYMANKMKTVEYVVIIQLCYNVYLIEIVTQMLNEGILYLITIIIKVMCYKYYLL